MLWQANVLGEPESVRGALDRWRDDLGRVGWKGWGQTVELYLLSMGALSSLFLTQHPGEVDDRFAFTAQAPIRPRQNVEASIRCLFADPDRFWDRLLFDPYKRKRRKAKSREAGAERADCRSLPYCSD